MTAPPSVEKNWLEWRLALLAEAGQEPEAAGQLERRLIEDSAPIFSRAGLVGQLLCMKKATHNNGFTVASWLPVLRVVEARRQGGAAAGPRPSTPSERTTGSQRQLVDAVGQRERTDPYRYNLAHHTT